MSTSVAPDNDIQVPAFTPKYAPDGWYQQIFELEFETCNSAASAVHEKDWENNDIGWATMKFYKSDGQGGEIECTDQTDIDLNCIRTDMEWMPNIDYMIKGGHVSQISLTPCDLYIWVQGAVIDSQYGVPPKTFAEGGINMAYVSARERAGLDGVAGTILYYDGAPGMLPAGSGTNRLRFVCRHNAGIKHRLQAVFDIFRG